MKIERGDTYITFDEGDAVAKEHLGRWKLVDGEGEGCEACPFNGYTTACRGGLDAGCYATREGYYVKA